MFMSKILLVGALALAPVPAVGLTTESFCAAYAESLRPEIMEKFAGDPQAAAELMLLFPDKTFDQIIDETFDQAVAACVTAMKAG